VTVTDDTVDVPTFDTAFTPLLDAATRADVRVRTVSGRRRFADRAGKSLLWAAVILTAVPLVAIVIVLVAKGAHVLTWHFFTGDIPAVTGQTAQGCENISEAFRAKYGLDCTPPRPAMGPAILGTLLSTGIAALIAIPLGILGAVYLDEFSPKGRLARVIRFFSDVMTGVPSIVMGMFIYTAWVVHFGTDGRSAFAAALALACLMLPIVVRTSEEMLRTVPDELRHAGLALGGRRWHGIVRIVLPAALPGLTSGAILAIVRAAGETAPVLFTIGITFTPNASPTGGNTTLAQQIYNGAKSGDPLANELAWGAAVTLVLVVFVLTAIARFATSRFTAALEG
jgi:phosphate transport system permease protein